MTVCPKKSPLNLNDDILQSEKVKINDESREDIMEYSSDLIEDVLFKEIITNLSIVEDPDRYFNW